MKIIKEINLEEVKVNKYGRYDWINSINATLPFTYGDIDGEITITGYDYSNGNIIVSYNNDIFSLAPSSIVTCGLGTILGKITINFKYQNGTLIKDEHRDLILLDGFYKFDKNKRKRKYYYFKCNVCGWEKGVISEHNVTKGMGCACCSGRVVVHGINDIPTTAPWMIKFFQGGVDEAMLYTKGNGAYIYPKCPDCGRIHNKKVRIIDLYRRKNFGCVCSSGKVSYPEKFIMSLLEQLKINFKFQLTHKDFQWVDTFRYDFYLPDFNCIIEANGEQHYRDTPYGLYRDQLMIDQKKKEIAINNGVVNYLEIDCQKSNLEYIKNSILSSKLLSLLDIDKNKVDWVECDSFATLNLVKSVCDYYMNNNRPSTKEIAKVFHLDYSTICRYLNLGKVHNWSDYNSNMKKIEIYKNNISLGIFNSAKEVINLFDNNLKLHNIYAACSGKYKNNYHMGYVFKYVA